MWSLQHPASARLLESLLSSRQLVGKLASLDCNAALACGRVQLPPAGAAARLTSLTLGHDWNELTAAQLAAVAQLSSLQQLSLDLGQCRGDPSAAGFSRRWGPWRGCGS
jgi:hypothetical protein